MKKYDEEFRKTAVKKVLDGQSVASVARELGVSEAILFKWKRERIQSGTDAEKQLAEAHKRIKELEMERDILKKAALIFGRGG